MNDLILLATFYAWKVILSLISRSYLFISKLDDIVDFVVKLYITLSKFMRDASIKIEPLIVLLIKNNKEKWLVAVFV